MSATEAQITWTPGQHVTSQNLFLDQSAAAVEGNCIEGCTIIVQGMNPTVSSYTTEPVLEAGKTYYYKVISIEDYPENNNRECNPRSANGYFDHWAVSGPWWQVEGGNIHGENQIVSRVPAGEALVRLNLWGTGGMVTYRNLLNIGYGVKRG